MDNKGLTILCLLQWWGLLALILLASGRFLPYPDDPFMVAMRRHGVWLFPVPIISAIVGGLCARRGHSAAVVFLLTLTVLGASILLLMLITGGWPIWHDGTI